MLQSLLEKTYYKVPFTARIIIINWPLETFTAVLFLTRVIKYSACSLIVHPVVWLNSEQYSQWYKKLFCFSMLISLIIFIYRQLTKNLLEK